MADAWSGSASDDRIATQLPRANHLEGGGGEGGHGRGMKGREERGVVVVESDKRRAQGRTFGSFSIRFGWAGELDGMCGPTRADRSPEPVAPTPRPD